MQYLPDTERPPTILQWRGLTVIAASFVLFAVVIAFGEPWGLPLVLRVLFASGAGLGLAAGQLMRSNGRARHPAPSHAAP